MTIKSRRYFWMILLVFLTACGGQVGALPADTSVPVVVSPTLLPTFTLIPVTVTPSPLPTESIIPMITPDPIQVERWMEYQTALAKSFLSYLHPEEVICEWEILGQSDQEIYVWAICTGIIGIGTLEDPAVIHIELDGSIQIVEIPGGGTDYASDIREMFPLDAQEKYFGGLIHFQELMDHLNWRREHSEEPPLIVLSVQPIPSPLPEQPIIPMITPDSIQVERWKEYETALAAGLLFPPKEFLCEWDILGMSEQVLYVWVVCESITPFGVTKTGRNIYLSSSTPALIHLGKDGVIQNVEVPGPGISDYQRMFPVYIQEKFEAYSFGKAKELSNHIEWRRFHPEEPPLIVLNATPIP